LTSETCMDRRDGIHCTCWYDGYVCCYCGDGGYKDEHVEDEDYGWEV
jgi:hypothetical protein